MQCVGWRFPGATVFNEKGGGQTMNGWRFLKTLSLVSLLASLLLLNGCGAAKREHMRQREMEWQQRREEREKRDRESMYRAACDYYAKPFEIRVSRNPILSPVRRERVSPIGPPGMAS
jgi:hypothetical protein